MTIPANNQLPETDKKEKLNRRMLNLAQELLLAEMTAGTLLACGASYTSKVSGRFGLYETFNGEVIAFQPHFHLHFTLICKEFVLTSNLATIKSVIRQLDDYELSVSQ